MKTNIMRKYRGWKCSVLVGFSLVALLNGAITYGASNEPRNSSDRSGRSVSAGVPHLRGFTSYAENSSLQLFVNEVEGSFAVYIKASGMIWYSSPPDWQEESFASGFNKNIPPSMITIRTVDVNSSLFPANGYTNVVRRSGLTVRPIPDGARFEHTFPREGVTIPVDVRLENQELVVSIPFSEVQMDPEIGMRLIDVTLLPYFGAARTPEKGYIMVPDGSGALIYFNNRKSKQPYKQYVFGRDPVIQPLMRKEVSEQVYLPVFGLKRQDGGFFAVIEKGASRSWINAETAYQKTSYNAASAGCIVLDSDVVSFREKTGTPRDILIFETNPYRDVFQVRYFLLGPDKSDYTFMALLYRNYLMEKKGYHSSPLLAGNPAFLVNFLGASPKIKPVLGFPQRVQVPFTPFLVARDILTQLGRMGVEQIVVKYDGWERGGLFGDYPNRSEAASSLGGEKGLTQFLSWANARSIPVFLGTEPVLLYRSTLSLIPELHTNKTINRAPAQVFPYRMSTFEKLTTRKEGSYWFVKTPVLEHKYRTYLEYFVKRWTEGTVTIQGPGLSPDSLGNILASDFSLQGYNREETQSVFESLLAETAQRRRLLLSRPFAYALPYVDMVCDVPITSSRYEIEDETIPFYQMVLKGIKPFTNFAYNQDLDPVRSTLFMLETGAWPSMVFIGTHPEELRDSLLEPFMSTYTYDWFGKGISLYREVFPLLKRIKDAPIIEHRILSKNLRRVVYANGVGFYINYGDTAIKVGNVTVPPQSYVLTEGE